MSALRVARGFTGRDRILKFDGCYHGHADAVLVAGGSGVAQLGLPGSAGVPAGAVADTIVAPYNVVPVLDASIAAVIVEPVAANMNLVLPAPGFLEGLRAECDRVGALLIFDEVITGFRLHRGGAAAVFGVTPDLWTFGKVIGGGLPIGAFGGRRAVLSCLAPLGPVYQAGTLSGNPLATAAGRTVLESVTDADLADLSTRAQAFGDALAEAICAGGLGATVVAAGPLLGLYLAAEAPAAPRNYAEAKVLCSNGYYPRFFHEMLRRGVNLAPGAYEVLFPSLAHTAADFDATVEAARAAAAAVVAGS
jgi:glutamate-1-semialdehyde 2,1-aminomutase